VKCSLQRIRKRLPSRRTQDWNERVASEAARQARIEAAFDRADLFYSVGDPEPALEWLRAAETLSGELPPTYRERRARMIRDLAGTRRARGMPMSSGEAIWPVGLVR
jgi:hypothetical protein